MPETWVSPVSKSTAGRERNLILDLNSLNLPTFGVGISSGETLWMTCYGTICHSDWESLWQWHLGQGRKDSRILIKNLPFPTGPTVEQRHIGAIQTQLQNSHQIPPEENRQRWSNALHNSLNNANLKSLTLVLSPGKLRLRTAKKQQGMNPSSLRLNSAPAPITPSLGVSSPFLTFTSLCIITGWIIIDL